MIKYFKLFENKQFVKQQREQRIINGFNKPPTIIVDFRKEYPEGLNLEYDYLPKEIGDALHIISKYIDLDINLKSELLSEYAIGWKILYINGQYSMKIILNPIAKSFEIIPCIDIKDFSMINDLNDIFNMYNAVSDFNI